MITLEDINLQLDYIPEAYFLLYENESHDLTKYYFSDLESTIEKANELGFTLIGRNNVVDEMFNLNHVIFYDGRLGALKMDIKLTNENYLELRNFLYEKYQTRDHKLINKILKYSPFEKDIYLASLKG